MIIHITVATLPKARYGLGPLENWDRRFENFSSHGCNDCNRVLLPVYLEFDKCYHRTLETCSTDGFIIQATDKITRNTLQKCFLFFDKIRFIYSCA
jgi:hypothetical protein